MLLLSRKQDAEGDGPGTFRVLVLMELYSLTPLIYNAR